MRRQRLILWTLIVALVGAATAPAACAQAADWKQNQDSAVAGFPSPAAEAGRAGQRYGDFPAGGSRTSAD